MKPKTPEQKEKIRQSIIEWYKTHKNPRLGTKNTPQHNEAISKSRIGRFGGENNPNYGNHLSDSAKRSIGDAAKNRTPPMLGKKQRETTKIKIREKLTGRKQSEEVCKKKSEAWIKSQKCIDHLKQLNEKQKGGKHPRFGQRITDEHRLKLSGKNASNYQGGKSFEPYCILFNNEFKERVRAWYGYICVECGTPQFALKEKLHIHHANFNKKTCCDNSIPLFVCLCRSCHGKTQRKREYWEQHFTDMIQSYYQGKCYFTKKEMEVYTYV